MLKRKLSLSLLLSCSTIAFADTGFYVGGGLGDGIQQQSFSSLNNTQNTLAGRAFAGFQLTNWIGGELGYNYISSGSDWNNLGAPSVTIFDASITPGISLPIIPVTIYGRVGVAATSSSLNSSWTGQFSDGKTANLEYGAGVRLNIPLTSLFARIDYINYGQVNTNGNSQLSNTPSAVLASIGYQF